VALFHWVRKDQSFDHWTLDDIPWDHFDRSAVGAETIALVKAS